MTDQHTPPAYSHVLRVSDLATSHPTEIELIPDEAACAAIAEALGIAAVRKLRLTGRLAPLGKRDWRLTARLGATVVQPCVVTLAPVTTRIEEDVERTWLAGYTQPDASEHEVEMPEDVTQEPLGEVIDLGAVTMEALALALPLYPRAEGAELSASTFTEPGKAAMTDEDARPFAGLASLRDKLDGGETGH